MWYNNRAPPDILPEFGVHHDMSLTTAINDSIISIHHLIDTTVTKTRNIKKPLVWTLYIFNRQVSLLLT